jgi:hypothetical protein
VGHGARGVQLLPQWAGCGGWAGERRKNRLGVGCVLCCIA